jgi:hypothetical protein
MTKVHGACSSPQLRCLQPTPSTTTTASAVTPRRAARVQAAASCTPAHRDGTTFKFQLTTTNVHDVISNAFLVATDTHTDTPVLFIVNSSAAHGVMTFMPSNNREALSQELPLAGLSRLGGPTITYTDAGGRLLSPLHTFAHAKASSGTFDTTSVQAILEAVQVAVMMMQCTSVLWSPKLAEKAHIQVQALAFIDMRIHACHK